MRSVAFPVVLAVLVVGCVDREPQTHPRGVQRSLQSPRAPTTPVGRAVQEVQAAILPNAYPKALQEEVDSALTVVVATTHSFERRLGGSETELLGLADLTDGIELSLMDLASLIPTRDQAIHERIRLALLALASWRAERNRTSP